MAPQPNAINAYPPPSLITPAPLVKRQYTAPPDRMAQVTTWRGREGGAWDLPFFPIWNETRTCENRCLWGGAETVDNWLLCQNDKNCVCRPEKLSSAVVWASKCATVRCGEGNRVGAEYAQTVVLEFCRNAWRETGTLVSWAGTEARGFTVPRTGAFVDSIFVPTVPGQNGPDPTSNPTNGGNNNQPDGENRPTDGSSPTNSSSSSDSSDIALKAGLGAGIGALALILLFIGGFFLFRRHKKQKALRQSRFSTAPVEVDGGNTPALWTPKSPGQVAAENRQRAVSLTPGQQPVEMPVGYGWGETSSIKAENDKPRYQS